MTNKENFENNIKSFYGVSLPSDIINEEDVKLVFDNMKEASEAVKKYKGSRFKAFDNLENALLFSKSVIVSKEIDSCNQSQNDKNIEKLLSPFGSLHPRELSKLRKAIESGDYPTVEELIQTNPRYLVGSGDTPSILMEGPRYNACHIAAKANRHEILRFILNTISDKQFWKLLFPYDSNEVTESRIKFSLDLYLNTPCSERASCDTPLHFGCKWGSLETVSVLLSFPECDVEKSNKFGKKPSEVICERKGDKNMKTEILKLFESQLFIPLIRDDFCAQIGRPIKGVIERNDLNREVTAVAGPMSPKQAEELYKILKSPHKCTPSDRKIRLTDSRKGLERVCRNVCKGMAINWEEFWPFLNTRIDLTSDEGLKQLETHLRHIYYDLDKSFSKECNDSSISQKSRQEFGCSQLLDQISKLSLNSSGMLSTDDSQSESFKECSVVSQINLDEMDESSNDSFTSAYSSPIYLYDFYINGPKISREDMDAALALQHIIETDRCLEYDFIQDWFKRVREEEPQHFNFSPPSDTPLSSTPIKFQ